MFVWYIRTCCPADGEPGEAEAELIGRVSAMLGRPGTLKRLLGSKLGPVRRAAYVLVTHTCLRRVSRKLTTPACKVEAEMQ